MPTPAAIAESFRRLDFHDDTLCDIKVVPAQVLGEGTSLIVEIHLHRTSEKKAQVIRFSGCANLRVAMDFDVLAGNFPPNTSRVDAHTELNRIRDLIESQKRDWDVRYVGTSHSPHTKKLAAVDELVFFHVQFFGGAVDILARKYEVLTRDESISG